MYPHEDMCLYAIYRNQGVAGMEACVEQAAAMGLERICFVEPSQGRSQGWLDRFGAECRRLDDGHDIDVYSAIEARIIDGSGKLDAPAQLPDHIDLLFARAYELPFGQACLSMAEAKFEIATGFVSASMFLAETTRAYLNVLHKHPGVILNRPFDLLEHVGLSSADVPGAVVRLLARTAKKNHAMLCIHEGPRQPATSVLRSFDEANVPLLFGTGAIDTAQLGTYKQIHQVLMRLRRNVTTALIPVGPGEGLPLMIPPRADRGSLPEPVSSPAQPSYALFSQPLAQARPMIPSSNPDVPRMPLSILRPPVKRQYRQLH